MKTKKIVFISILLILICFWGWYFFVRIDRNRAIDIIMKNVSGLTKESFEGFGDDYLIARAKAFRAKQDTFELDGKTYVTNTGKSK